MQPYNRNLSSPWLIWSKLPVFTVLQLQFLVQEGWLWRINEIHYFSLYFTNVRAWPEEDLLTLFILLSSCESSDTACPHFHCVRGLWLKRVSFTKYSSCTEMFWCPSCQEQGIVGWPCSSAFREQGNVGAQSYGSENSFLGAISTQPLRYSSQLKVATRLVIATAPWLGWGHLECFRFVQI